MHEGSSCSSSRTGAAPQCPSEHKERVSPLASPRQPNPPLPFPFPPPGVGRAAGQGGGGVGCTVRVGARPPPADEVCGAEPLHPLGQVRGGWGTASHHAAPRSAFRLGRSVHAMGCPLTPQPSRGRYRSVVDMVRSWHHEQQHYSFPHPRECNPRCPSKCSGSVCSHYTQVRALAPH